MVTQTLPEAIRQDLAQVATSYGQALVRWAEQTLETIAYVQSELARLSQELEEQAQKPAPSVPQQPTPQQ
jgi:hypothetical protein